jgi:hypothetical protein
MVHAIVALNHKISYGFVGESCNTYIKKKKMIGLWAIGAILEFNTKNMYPYEEEE